MRDHLKTIVPAIVIAGVCCLGAAAQTSSTNGSTVTSDTGTSKAATADQAFVMKAAQGGMAEVEFGQLATQKATSDQVKQFGQRMVDDHSKANDELKQIANQKGMATPTKLSSKDAATKARLEKLSGQQFDHAYMQTMVRDHTKDVAEFRTESKTAKDPDLKNFVRQTLPTLEEHLKQAKRIAPKTSAMKKGQETAGGAF